MMQIHCLKRSLVIPAKAGIQSHVILRPKAVPQGLHRSPSGSTRGAEGSQTGFFPPNCSADPPRILAGATLRITWKEIVLRPRNKKGFALMGVVALLILLGLFTAVGFSLVASSSGSYANLVQGAQAFAISCAGAEWYIEQLNSDTDWSDQSSQTRLFAQGSFTIGFFAYDSASDRLTFTSTGTVTSNMAGVTIKRWQKWIVERTAGHATKVPNSWDGT